MTFEPGVGAALPYLVGTLLLAAALSFVLTPLVRAAAHRLGMVDHPDERRVNLSPVPRAGGIAVAAACLVAIVTFLVLNGNGSGAETIAGPTPALRAPSSIGTSELIALIGGGALAAFIGLLDDLLQLRARYQLAGQVVVALVAVAFGATPELVSSPFGGFIDLSGPIGAGFAVVWILGMVNSINFIDGLDGLSSGIGLIAAMTLGLLSLTTAVGPLGQPYVAVLCFALAGSLAGFLRWNFHPASVFVGTSGVMFLGYTLALLSILGTAKVAVALLVLGVPIIDTFWIIVRRLAQRRSPFAPDRGHIHHRLLDIGLSHTQTVLLIYAICVALGAMALILSAIAQVVAFAALTLVTGLAFFIITRREADASTRLATTSSTPAPTSGTAATATPTAEARRPAVPPAEARRAAVTTASPGIPAPASVTTPLPPAAKPGDEAVPREAASR